MKTIRLSIFVIGIFFPFLMLLVADGLRIITPDLVRHLVVDPALKDIVVGSRSRDLFSHLTLNETLFLVVPHMMLAGVIIGLGLVYRHRLPILFPTLAGFGFLAYAYLMNEFNPDAQGALVYIFGPIYSLVFVFIGWLIGFGVDRLALQKNR